MFSFFYFLYCWRSSNGLLFGKEGIVSSFRITNTNFIFFLFHDTATKLLLLLVGGCYWTDGAYVEWQTIKALSLFVEIWKNKYWLIFLHRLLPSSMFSQSVLWGHPVTVRLHHHCLLGQHGMCSRTIKTELEEGRTKPEVCTPGIVITCLSPVLLNNFPPLTLHLSNVVSLPVLSRAPQNSPHFFCLLSLARLTWEKLACLKESNDSWFVHNNYIGTDDCVRITKNKHKLICLCSSDNVYLHH